jgi:uncharacterized membrane protein
MVDFFIILFLVIILLLTIIFKAHLTHKVRQMSSDLDEFRWKNDIGSEVQELKKAVNDLQKTIDSIKTAKVPIVKEKVEEITKVPPVKIEATEIKVVDKTEEKKETVEPTIEKVEETVIDKVKEPLLEKAEIFENKNLAQKITPIVETTPYPQYQYLNDKPVKEKKKTDFERFIGENLINKIGIAILVIGVGLFVKFAIDKDWINEWGRVGIGLLAGGLLIGLGHYLRKSFHAFSSVLVGGGIAVFYFSIAIAFRQYELMNQTMAFISMVIITALAVFLSLRYNRLELAIIAMIGGFATPFMVSTDAGNYIILFTYLMILNVGMLVMAYFKKWNIMHLLAFIFTVLIFGGWLIMKMMGDTDVPYEGALIFASMFFVVFFLMNIINNIREKEKFRAAEIGMIVTDVALYFTVGMIILDHIYDGNLQGVFTAALAVFNLAFAIVFYKTKRVDKILVQLLIGQTLMFISLVAPIQFDGNYITLFWAAEVVLLLWFSQKSGIILTRIASFAVIVVMAISMIWDWYDYYLIGDYTLPIIINRAFITGFATVASLFISLLLVRREKSDMYLPGIPKKVYTGIITPLFIVFLYFWLFNELLYQLNEYVSYEKTILIIIDTFNLAFFAGLIIWAKLKKNQPLFIGMSAIGLAGIVAYICYFNFQAIFIRNAYLLFDANFSQFLWHYAEIALIFLILTLIALEVTKSMQILRSSVGSLFLWFASSVVVYIFSYELIHFSVLINYEPGFEISVFALQAQKIGLPILWGICSFVFLFIGMKRVRMLRVISLSLFFITLLKLAIFDLRGISEAGRIAAFISLGIILLVMSFMYQKVKKLIFDADKEEQEKIEAEKKSEKDEQINQP